MKIIKKLLLVLLSLALTQIVFAQAPIISYNAPSYNLVLGSSYNFNPSNTGGAVPPTTYGQVAFFVGSTTETGGYINGTGSAAEFSFPQQSTMDAAGNLYIADSQNNVVRESTPAGVVTTFAGSLTGVNGFTNATGTAALFDFPDGLTIDASGNLYVSDYNNNAIRKITPAGVVTTFYSSGGATFGPGGICFDHSGNLIVAAQDASQIIKINSLGVASVIAGSTPGYVNATGISAKFNTPADVRVDASGNIFVVDFENNAIRKITTAGVVSTFAGSNVSGNTPGYANGVGTAAKFNNPGGLVISPGGVIYVADWYNNDIRRIMPDGTVSLLAGSASQTHGDADGVGTAALFYAPVSMYLDTTGTAYVSEFGGERIRKITLTGYTLQGTLPPGLAFNGASGAISGTPTSVFSPVTDTVTSWNGSGYASTTVKFTSSTSAPIIAYDVSTDTIAVGTPYSLTPSNTGGPVPANTYGQVTTFAGSTSATSGYTNATGTSARFNHPAASVMDASGNLYVADGSNNAIRKIDPSGVVTTFAGSASGTSGSTDGTGTAALFNNPQGIAIDASGNLVVSDYGNNSIRKIDPTGVVTTFYHSTGSFGPMGLIIDASGNIIIAAKTFQRILKITPSAAVSTIAGSTVGYTNATGASAQFSSPTDVKMDALGNLFVADNANNAIREIDPTGVVTTFAGSNVSGNTGSFLDGVGTAARFNSPAGLAIAPGNIVYVTDVANNDIRRIMPDGTVSLIAGSLSQTTGNSDGTGTAAGFNQPGSIFIDNTVTAYITESAGNRVRKVVLTGYSLAGTLPSGLSFSATTGTVSGTVAGTLTPTMVTVRAFNAGGSSTVALLLGAATNDWKGTGTPPTDWGTGSNWTKGTVPGPLDIARIGVNVSYTNQPILAASTSINTLSFGGAHAPAGGPVLTINSGAVLSSTTGFTLTASTSATINGPGGLTISGNSPLAAGQLLTAAKNLIITLNPNTFISNPTYAPNSTYPQGPFTFNFKLASDANGSASIVAIPASSGVTGTVGVQRYITGGTPTDRDYRYFSSPVNAGFNGWSKIFSTNYTFTNPEGGGMYSTGTSGPAGGFDNKGNPTQYLYTENNVICNSSFDCGNFKGINNLTAAPQYLIDPNNGVYYTVPVGSGFMCFFRGEKPNTKNNEAAGTDPFSNTNPALPYADTLTAIGNLNYGRVAVRDWFTPSVATLSYHVLGTSGVPNNIRVRGFNFVGNPYPSTIDWETYNSTLPNSGMYGTLIDTFIYEYTYYMGAGIYGAYTKGGMSTHNASRYISSGAGFFIVATTTGATFAFNESAKTSTQPPAGQGVFMSTKPIAQTDKQYLRLEVSADTAHWDDMVVWFVGSSKVSYEPGGDVPYLTGFNSVGLSSLSSDNVQLAINRQPMPGNERRIIGLHEDMPNSGTYHFNLRQVIGISKLYDVWLLDTYKRDSVDLRTSVTYDFKVDKSDSATFNDNRFSLLIKQNPANAYRLLDFTANKITQAVRQVQVVWKTQNEENYTHFTVERSTDNGKTFTVLDGVNSSAQGTYSFVDNTPIIGPNFYRLKQVDINNVTSYSKTVMVRYDNLNDQLTGAKLNIFPNPAKSEISLAITPEKEGPAVYKVSFSSAIGTVVRSFSISQRTYQGNVNDLLPGTYLVKIVDDKTGAMVAEGKFVKL